MSTADLDKMITRLRGELDRFGSIADAARQIGDAKGFGLRDVCNGRKRLTAQLLARLAAEGVDPLYVLTGERLVVRSGLNPMLRAVVDDLERCSPEKQIEAVKYVAMLAAGMTPPPLPTVPIAPARKPPAKGAASTKQKKRG